MFFASMGKTPRVLLSVGVHHGAVKLAVSLISATAPQPFKALLVPVSGEDSCTIENVDFRSFKCELGWLSPVIFIVQQNI